MKPGIAKLFPFLHLRGKLLIAFVGLAVVPLVILAIYGIGSATHALRAANANHLRLELLSNVGHIEAYVGSIVADTTFLVSGLEEQPGPLAAAPEQRAEIARRFTRFAAIHPQFYQVRLIGPDGRELVRVDRVGTEVRVVPERALQDKSDRYYVKEALARSTAATYISPIDLNVERGRIEKPERLVFRVVRQVRSPGGQGEVRGLVVLNVFASAILQHLELLRPDPDVAVLLIGRDGGFVREMCSSDDAGACTYGFGRVQDQLADFGPDTVGALLSGRLGVMVEAPERFISHVPVAVGGDGVGERWQLAIVYPRDFVLAPIQRMKRLFYVITAVAAALALILAGLAARALTTPIRQILHFVQGVEAGDFRRELDVETRDEIEELATGVKRTAVALEEAQQRLVGWNEDLQAEVNRHVAEVESLLEARHAMVQQLRKADRLASLGMLSASLAHEIGNPLASIKTVIQVHLRDPSISESTEGALSTVLEEIDRLAAILERVTGFVRPVRGRPVAVSLGEVFERVVFLVGRNAVKKGIELSLEGDGIDKPIAAHGQRLEQVLLNLVMNSLQAIGDGPGEITVRVNTSATGIELAITDDGPGIPEPLRSSVFEPFVTTKDGGTGLGLPIVRQIITEMGGQVALELAETGGTCVRIALPVSETVAAELAQEAMS